MIKNITFAFALLISLVVAQ